MNIFEEIAKAEKSLKSFAVITVINGEEHGTADSGKKMILYSDGTCVGTIGGGIFEFECMKVVAEILKKGRSTQVITFSNVELFVECYEPKNTIVILGGGHVGNALLKTIKLLPFSSILIDDRDESQIKESISLATKYIKCTNYEEAILNNDIPDGAYYFSAAWNHANDAAALKGALQKNAAYIGMVGSHDKVQKLFSYLLKQGVSKEKLDKIYSPVGLDIADDSPEEIAFAIVAEILMIKNKGKGTNCKNIKDKFLVGNCENIKVKKEVK